jgi:hypothetical protein
MLFGSANLLMWAWAGCPQRETISILRRHLVPLLRTHPAVWGNFLSRIWSLFADIFSDAWQSFLPILVISPLSATSLVSSGISCALPWDALPQDSRKVYSRQDTNLTAMSVVTKFCSVLMTILQAEIYIGPTINTESKIWDSHDCVFFWDVTPLSLVDVYLRISEPTLLTIRIVG